MKSVSCNWQNNS